MELAAEGLFAGIDRLGCRFYFLDSGIVMSIMFSCVWTGLSATSLVSPNLGLLEMNLVHGMRIILQTAQCIKKW
jgi:hypothetical protein